MVLFPQDLEDPLTENSPYNNAQIQAWYSYNFLKERWTLLNEDWYYFVNIMCRLNNTNINAIPPEIISGQEN